MRDARLAPDLFQDKTTCEHTESSKLGSLQSENVDFVFVALPKGDFQSHFVFNDFLLGKFRFHFIQGAFDKESTRFSVM